MRQMQRDHRAVREQLQLLQGFLPIDGPSASGAWASHPPSVSQSHGRLLSQRTHPSADWRTHKVYGCSIGMLAWCRGLPCVLGILGCHPGGCEPDWIRAATYEQQLRLGEGRNSGPAVGLVSAFSRRPCVIASRKLVV